MSKQESKGTKNNEKISRQAWLDLKPENLIYPTLILGSSRYQAVEALVTEILKKKDERFTILQSGTSPQSNRLMENPAVYVLDLNKKEAALPFSLNFFGGSLEEVRKRVDFLFSLLAPSSQYFSTRYDYTTCETVLLNTVTVVKILLGEKGTLKDVLTVLDARDEGRRMVIQFSKLNEVVTNAYFRGLSDWFEDYYYNGKEKKIQDDTLELKCFLIKINDIFKSLREDKAPSIQDFFAKYKGLIVIENQEKGFGQEVLLNPIIYYALVNPIHLFLVDTFPTVSQLVLNHYGEKMPFPLYLAFSTKKRLLGFSAIPAEIGEFIDLFKNLILTSQLSIKDAKEFCFLFNDIVSWIKASHEEVLNHPLSDYYNCFNPMEMSYGLEGKVIAYFQTKGKINVPINAFL